MPIAADHLIPAALEDGLVVQLGVVAAAVQALLSATDAVGASTTMVGTAEACTTTVGASAAMATTVGYHMGKLRLDDPSNRM